MKYPDSLSEKHEECAVNATKFLSIFCRAKECGFFVLAHMLCIFSGSGAGEAEERAGQQGEGSGEDSKSQPKAQKIGKFWERW